MLPPWSFVQALPQAAQLVAVPLGVSHPVAAVQSRKPWLQPVGTQVPVAQDAAEFGNEQGVLQAPQWASVVTLCSQPLSGFPSQLSQPESQVGEQSKLPGPPAQVLLPWSLLQALPQAAQLEGVPSVVSQPAADVQLAKPALQAPMLQVPVLQEAAAFGNEQGVSQSLQSVTVRMLRSQPFSVLPSQLLQPTSQLGWQPVAVLQLVVP